MMPKVSLRIFAIFGSVTIFAISTYQCAGLLFSTTATAANSLAVEQKLTWLPELGINLSLRLDSVSVWFVILSALTSVVAFSLRGTWYRKSPRLFAALGFFLIFALNAAFLSTDLVVFYLGYEAVFIPMIFMVGIWGENQKATSLFRFFLMSFFGSILMLVSIFYLMSLYHSQTGMWSSNLADLMQLSHTNPDSLRYAFFGFFLAFAIKVPLVPFHGWLKEVYVNAPMPATIWMSAILSKLGVFGFIRFVIPLFPEAALHYQGWLVTLATLSVLYSGFLAIRANNPKELLAYSSISHLGFVMLGVFSLRSSGETSAILLSIGHALESAILFYLLFQIDERKEGLSLSTSHGLAKRYPTLFVALFLGVMASVSLPGTLNFNGEFMVLLNAYPVSALCTILSGLGVIFGAVYMLRFYQQLGLSKKIDLGSETRGVKDLSGYDLVLFVLVFAMIIYGGVQPAIFLKGN
jgi:NADH-quinone oxidoreductase subunit M